MKRIISILSVVLMLVSFGTTAQAGDVPEGLLSNDDALVFFGEVITYDKNNSAEIEVSPVKKIKGDVVIGEWVTFNEPSPVGAKIKEGELYLFAFFDENNPIYIFETSSFNPTELELEDAEGDMWERFEQYLNEGKYEEAEKDRIDRENADLKVVDKELSLSELLMLKNFPDDNIYVSIKGTKYMLDKEKFVALADTLMLTDIENTRVNDMQGFYILVGDDLSSYAFFSGDCKVERHAPFMSRIPYADFTIKTDDLAKIYNLFPIEARATMMIEKSSANHLLICAIGIAVLVFALGFTIGHKRRKCKKENTEE